MNVERTPGERRRGCAFPGEIQPVRSRVCVSFCPSGFETRGGAHNRAKYLTTSGMGVLVCGREAARPRMRGTPSERTACDTSRATPDGSSDIGRTVTRT